MYKKSNCQLSRRDTIKKISSKFLKRLIGGAAPGFWECLSDPFYCAGYHTGYKPPSNKPIKPDCNANPIYSQHGCH